MEHTLEILVELEVDGVAAASFPYRFVRPITFFENFLVENFGDVGFVAPTDTNAIPTEAQALFVTSDQDFVLRINGESAMEFPIKCGGFLLIVGSAMTQTPFLTVKATATLPARIWGFLAGK